MGQAKLSPPLSSSAAKLLIRSPEMYFSIALSLALVFCAAVSHGRRRSDLHAGLLYVRDTDFNTRGHDAELEDDRVRDLYARDPAFMTNHAALKHQEGGTSGCPS